MAAAREVVIPYAPRPQFMPFHERKERWAVIVAHRRAGKTVATINDLIKAAITCQKPDGRFAYIAPLFNQAKDVAWTYLKHYAAPILSSSPNETELRVDLINGARIRLYGADNPDRLRGIYLDGVILDEYADMHPRVWGEVIRPLLADRRGHATFIGTPKGRNDFFKTYENALIDHTWLPLMLRASDTGIVPADELEDAQRDMTPEQYEQEFECSFEAAIVGAYYGREVAQAERDGRVTDCPYEPDLPVHTAWDLGVGDATAIWFFQVHGLDARLIDHYENTGYAADHYVELLQRKGYTYGEHWLPHDARVKEWTNAGKGGFARSRMETLVDLGIRPRIVPMHKVEDGINAARVSLKRCIFDAERCREGLGALREYRAEYDDKAKAFKNHPKHDWTSHTADAFRYFAMAWREIVPQIAPPPKPEPRNLKNMTWDELMKAQPKRRERV